MEKSKLTEKNQTSAALQSYKDLCTQFYDIDKPDAPEVPLAYYRQLIERIGGPVLEAMCGSGRFLVPLLKGGADVDGVDASPEMLAACHKKCAKAKLSPAIYQQFLHQLDLPRRYRLVLITAGSFSLISDSVEATQSLRGLFECLEPGGEILIEGCTRQNRPGIERFQSGGRWSGRWVTRADGARIVFSDLSTFDAARDVVESIMKYELFDGSRLLMTEAEYMELKLYDAEELLSLVSSAGFADAKALSPTDFGAPRADDPMIAVSAQKPLN